MALQKIPGRAIKLGTDTAGDVAYFDGAAWQRLAIGEVGQVLTMNPAGFPNWGNAPSYQGRTFGYDAGGRTTSTVKSDVIQKYSFSTNGNATDVSDLTVARDKVTSSASATHGYYTGGSNFGSTIRNIMDKQQFSTSSNATDVGDLLGTTAEGAGLAAPSNSQTYGYIAGGAHATTDAGINTIQKYSFATDGNSTDVADSTTAHFQGSGHSDWTGGYGYKAGGYSTAHGGRLNIIERYPFASDTNATDVGDLFTFTSDISGTSSLTHAYTQGGNSSVAIFDHIQKFAFAATSNSTDIGNLTIPRYHVSEASSTTHGYACTGNDDWSVNYNVTIDRYTFSSDADATDVGDVLVAHTAAAGTQV
jgi:hypothetical protein